MTRQRQQIIAFLTSPDCQLFGSLQRLITTKKNLDDLLTHGQGLENCLYALECINNNAATYSSITALVNDVSAFSKTASKDRNRIFLFLRRYKWVLFRGTDAVITPLLSDKLYTDCKAGSYTFPLLQLYKDLSYQFEDLGALAVRLQQDVAKKIMQNQLQLLHIPLVEWFQQHKTGLFQEGIIVDLSSSYFNALLQITDNNRAYLLALLEEVQLNGHIYENEETLQQAIETLFVSVESIKKDVLHYLQHETRHSSALTEQDPQLDTLENFDNSHSGMQDGLLPGSIAAMLTFSEVTLLVVESGACSHTLHYLQELHNFHGAHFTSFADLVREVSSLHQASIHTRNKEAGLIRTFLEGPNCSLFYELVDINDRDVQRLLPLRANACLTFQLLLHFSRIHLQVATMKELCQAVQTGHVLYVEKRRGQWEQELLEFVNTTLQVKYLLNPHSEQPIPTRLVLAESEQFNMNNVDELVRYCGNEIARAYQYYCEFKFKMVEFHNMEDLADAFYDRHIMTLKRSVTQTAKALLFIYLTEGPSGYSSQVLLEAEEPADLMTVSSSASLNSPVPSPREGKHHHAAQREQYLSVAPSASSSRRSSRRNSLLSSATSSRRNSAELAFPEGIRLFKEIEALLSATENGGSLALATIMNIEIKVKTTLFQVNLLN
jgi:hypothetical protein